jgi:hypothetical protein
MKDDDYDDDDDEDDEIPYLNVKTFKANTFTSTN